MCTSRLQHVHVDGRLYLSVLPVSILLCPCSCREARLRGPGQAGGARRVARAERPDGVEAADSRRTRSGAREIAYQIARAGSCIAPASATTKVAVLFFRTARFINIKIRRIATFR